MSIESYPPPPTNVGTITSIAGGIGITNTPEPITSTGTVDLDIDSLTTEVTPAEGDLFPMVDVSVGTSPSAQRKVTLTSLRLAVLAYVSNTNQAWRQMTTTTTTTFTGAGTVGMAAPAESSPGGVAASIEADGRWVQFSTGTALNADAGWTTTTAAVTQTQLLPDTTWVVKTGPVAADIANVRVWVGLFNGDPIASDTAGTAAGGNSYGFRYSTSAGDTTWKTWTKDGAGNSTVKDSGVAISADTKYTLRAVWVTSSRVDFYINGAFINSHITGTDNMPSSTVDFFVETAARNLTAGTARRLKIHRFAMFTN